MVGVDSARTAPEARALEAFLRADPVAWPTLAPVVVERVGVQRLAAIVAATRERLGGIDRVIDTAAGLAVTGPAGQVLAWARIDADDRLTGLLIAPALRGRDRNPAAARVVGHLVPYAVVGAGVAGCWTRDTVLGWAGSLLVLAATVVLFEGLTAPAFRPWWTRRTVELLALVGPVSALRWPRLATSGGAADLAAGVVALVAVVALLAYARGGSGPSWALPSFPVDGRWYVVQGGPSRLVNHHRAVPEQRGAVDLVRLGWAGPYRGDPRRLESHLSYGASVRSPCAGTVVAAVDGIEDQIPGTIRYAPPYGNHVVVDTGTERVTLAHLRPGTVAVTAGEVIEAGHPLGQVGNSGNSTAPHLHLHAERDGLGLELRFAGRLHRGRTVHGTTGVARVR
jgi:Peptidase family M23